MGIWGSGNALTLDLRGSYMEECHLLTFLSHNPDQPILCPLFSVNFYPP